MTMFQEMATESKLPNQIQLLNFVSFFLEEKLMNVNDLGIIPEWKLMEMKYNLEALNKVLKEVIFMHLCVL